MSLGVKNLHRFEGGSVLRLNPRFAERLGLAGRHRAWVGFGMARRSVDLEAREDVPDGELQIGSLAMEDLRVPDYIALKAQVQGRGVLLGPYVGVIYRADGDKLDERFLITRARYRTERLDTVTFHTPIGHFGLVQEYARHGGAVVIFGLDKVDPDKRLIEGFCYDPHSDRWRAGVFPYPGALYRRVGLSETWKSHFLSTIGDTGFNSYYADKWEVHEWLTQAPALHEHLPDTALYRRFDDLAGMVRVHGTVYVKPISGLGGFGVMRVQADGGGYRFGFREGDVNHDLCYDPAEAASFADEKLRRPMHLIQKGIALRRWQGSVVDIRLLMQKEWSDRWQLQGIIIRQGVKGSVVSNISSGGCAWTMEEFFEERLGWTVERRADLGARLEALGVSLCDQLDACGVRLCYVGVDVGVDDEDKLWIIEANMRDPDSTIALDINDKSLYNKLKTGPVVHGAWLCGFTPEEP